jgi:16S rRNA (uracil1498-N3)-methyltransferase
VNLLLLEAAELGAGGKVSLPPADRRARHITSVLRARPGQALRAGVTGGATGRAQVTAVEPGGAVSLEVVLDGPASPRPPVDLVLAVPRPKVVPRALETAAALGVGRVDLVNAWRVDRAYFGSPRLAPAALAADVRRGCEQGGSTWLPEVAVHRLFVPLVEEAAPRWRGRRLLVGHPRAVAALEEVARPGDQAPVVLAVGPEGGWIDAELGSLASAGFTPVRLGAAVLRVEAAIAALLAQLELLRRLQPPAAPAR